MKGHVLALLILGIAASTALPSRASGARERSLKGERAAIRALRAANNQAIARRDADATLSIAADDYVLVAGNDTIFRSADAMRARWTASFADPNQKGCVREAEKIAVGRNGGVLRAAESGRWRCPVTKPDGRAEPFGSYFAHWSKQSGQWRVVSDDYVTLGCLGSAC